MNNQVLKLEGIGKHFRQGEQELNILKDVSLEINKGESVALVGPSGCGKSTLLQIAGLLEKPSSGRIYIDGEDTSELSGHRKTLLRRYKIGFIYQFHHLLPEFTALENVVLPQLMTGQKKSIARDKAAHLLEKLGLAKRLGHRPSELSGGEQQRVAIARSIANDPLLLLADEPTGNLDPHSSENVFEIFLSAIKDAGLATLLVTHNAELANRLNRKISLREGQLVEVTA